MTSGMKKKDDNNPETEIVELQSSESVSDSDVSKVDVLLSALIVTTATNPKEFTEQKYVSPFTKSEIGKLKSKLFKLVDKF